MIEVAFFEDDPRTQEQLHKSLSKLRLPITFGDTRPKAAVKRGFPAASGLRYTMSPRWLRTWSSTQGQL